MEPINHDALQRITMTADQLSPPDPVKEEQASATETGHQKSLEYIGAYIKIAVVENLPKIYTGAARLIEWFKGVCDAVLQWTYSEDNTIKVSISQPDKISREPGTLRDDMARYIQHQKQKAVGVLGATIRDTKLPDTQPQPGGACPQRNHRAKVPPRT